MPLIFPQLNNSDIHAGIIFAHWQNLYFCVGLIYYWKCSARYWMKYPEIKAFSDPYFPVYGIVSVFFRISTESEILSKYGKTRIRFCLHIGKYGSEKARISAYFTQWENRTWMLINLVSFNTKSKDWETIWNNNKGCVNLEINFWYKHKFSCYVIILVLQWKIVYENFISTLTRTLNL